MSISIIIESVSMYDHCRLYNNIHHISWKYCSLKRLVGDFDLASLEVNVSSARAFIPLAAEIDMPFAQDSIP